MKMFGKKKRQIEHVTFVQPVKGEAYFYTPIAYATRSGKSKVFKDSDLALAGKLKLVFEREKMTWFEIREEKTSNEHFFALYYYPHRLVMQRAPLIEEKSTLQEIKRLFDFFVTQELNRPAEVRRSQSPSAYGPVQEEESGEAEEIEAVAMEPEVIR